MSFRFPQPTNEDDFELTCLRFLRQSWKCPTLNQYGKRGERQFGIDLIDECGGIPLRAVQCKHHEPDKTIPPAEIEAEIAKMLASALPVDEYYILTTARKTTHAQNTIIKINREHQVTGKFKVFLWAWTDIETLLSEMDDVAQDRILRGDSGRSAPAIRQLIYSAMGEHLDRDLYASASVLDLELDGIKTSLDRYEVEVAESKIKLIETRADDKLQPHHRYQLKIFRFRILSGRWHWNQAGRELIDAKRFMPSTERARINEAFGYELTGDTEKAHALASELRPEFSQSVRLLTIWIRTSSPNAAFATLAEIAAPFVNEDEELNLALAHRAFLEDRFDGALPHARRATELNANSPHAWFVLGQAKHASSLNVASGFQNTLLREAEAHYDRALYLAHVQRLFGLEAAVRFNRGKVRHVLGDGRAETDYAAAVELASPDQGLRTEYGGYLLELGRFDDALRELAVDGGDPDGTRLFYKSAALYGRNRGDDRKQAIELLQAVIDSTPAPKWADAHILLVQWSIDGKFQVSARAAITRTSLSNDNPLVYHTIAGWLAKSEDQAEAAKVEFGHALTFLSSTDLRDHVFLLAQALVSVDEDELALPLLLQCYRPGVFDDECRKLLDCARRLNHHDVSSRVCRELREAGEADPRIVLSEISILQMYDPHEALRVAQSYLAEHPNDRHVALWQSTLALRLDKRELLISDLGRLPTANDVTPEGSSLVIRILCATDRGAEALRYAYEALRVHFDAEFVHGQFIACFLELSDHCPELRIGGTVAPGMAVCYHHEHEAIDRWVIIESTHEPELLLDEVSLDHPSSVALSGHKVGDLVVLSNAGIQPRQVRIRDVLHKYIHRFRNCMNQFQVRFPGGSACQLVHVGSDDDFDPSPILQSLADQRKQVEFLDGLYREKPLPIYMYAKLSGHNEFEAWVHLASQQDLGIRCFNGQAEELGAGLDQLKQSKAIVIDLTAIFTLAQLDLLNVLKASKRTMLVAQTTFDYIHYILELAKDGGRSPGVMRLTDDGKLGFLEISPEQRARHFAFLENIRNSVRENCQIVPCLNAVTLNPKRREGLVQSLGRHNLDSMLIGAAPDTVFWTDDLILGIIGRTDFGAARAWTQIVLFMMQTEKVIDQLEYHRAVAKLVGWHYHGVLWNASTLLAAADIADWHTDQWPVPAVVKCLGNAEANPIERLQIAAEAVRSIWERDISPLSKQGFLFCILSGIGSKRLVTRLGQNVRRLFGVDAFSAEEVLSCIAYWLQHPTGFTWQP